MGPAGADLSARTADDFAPEAADERPAKSEPVGENRLPCTWHKTQDRASVPLLLQQRAQKHQRQPHQPGGLAQKQSPTMCPEVAASGSTRTVSETVVDGATCSPALFAHCLRSSHRHSGLPHAGQLVGRSRSCGTLWTMASGCMTNLRCLPCHQSAMSTRCAVPHAEMCVLDSASAVAHMMPCTWQGTHCCWVRASWGTSLGAGLLKPSRAQDRVSRMLHRSGCNAQMAATPTSQIPSKAGALEGIYKHRSPMRSCGRLFESPMCTGAQLQRCVQG